MRELLFKSLCGASAMVPVRPYFAIPIRVAWQPSSSHAYANTGFTFGDISRELGRLWSELPEKDREVREHVRQIPAVAAA